MTTHPLDTAPTPDVKGNPTQCEDDQDNLGRSMSRRSVQGVAASILRSVSRSSRPVVITGDEARILAGPAPDGGLAAWLCVVACALEQFCVFGFSESALELSTSGVRYRY